MNPPQDIFHDVRYRFHPAIILDIAYPRALRSKIRLMFGILFFLSLGGLGFLLWKGGIFSSTSLLEILFRLWGIFQSGGVFEKTFGGAMILAGCWILHLALEWMHRSYYYHVEALLERGETGVKAAYTTPNFETNELYLLTREGDLLESFARSSYGRRIFERAGLPATAVDAFLQSRAGVVDFRFFQEIASVFTLRDVVLALVSGDQAFSQMVFEKGVRPEDLTAAAEWVERELKERRRKTRWWGRVNLGQTRGIGADLSYGVAYALERYGVDLTKTISQKNVRHLYGNDALLQMETVLSRGANANVLLVGEEGGGLIDLVMDFTHDVVNGFTHPSLAGKHIILLDWKSFLSRMRTKQDLETQFFRMMDSGVHAKNVIVVIDDLPGFIIGADAVGSDVVSLLDPYAASGFVQYIATADIGRYHTLLEQNGAFRARFEPVLIPTPESSALILTLEDAARPLERMAHVLFTYPAIRALVDGVKRYFVDAVMPGAALDLMGELAQSCAARGDRTVDFDDVMNYIQAKTHIPVGTITDEERDRLANLEATLQMHVIGQHKALEVIANALRRQRAGVRNPNRPIGTFLFLGPTGVGKTETAKALARVFFENEESLSRLDMSEFQAEDGLARLIGADGRAGILANMLREKPYGVLLLDEFEKTHPKVLDLFLQVFDEGVFHDAAGKRVNAQNTILIATSNAGAMAIREAVKSGIPLESVEKQIIDAVVAEGKYKPELLNRFDGIVIFHPMTRDEYAQVALLMVEKLRHRLREKDIDVAVNDVLIEALLAKGVDPDFGARPMNRAVQELVEQKVAEKIIMGTVRPGMTVTFTEADFPDIFQRA